MYTRTDAVGMGWAAEAGPGESSLYLRLQENTIIRLAQEDSDGSGEFNCLPDGNDRRVGMAVEVNGETVIELMFRNLDSALRAVGFLELDDRSLVSYRRRRMGGS